MGQKMNDPQSDRTTYGACSRANSAHVHGPTLTLNELVLTRRNARAVRPALPSNNATAGRPLVGLAIVVKHYVIAMKSKISSNGMKICSMRTA